MKVLHRRWKSLQKRNPPKRVVEKLRNDRTVIRDGIFGGRRRDHSCRISIYGLVSLFYHILYIKSKKHVTGV